MVDVKFTKTNDEFTSLTMSGHANSAEYGSDIVCAGISAIVFGALNGFDQLAKPMFDLAVKDNYVSAKALSDECIVNKLLNFVYIQLRTVEDQYPKNIKITVMEV